MSVSMARNTNLDVLKDHMAVVFIQGKEFSSNELQQQMAATLGQSLLAQAESNASHPGQELQFKFLTN
jgi:ribosomal protein L22